MYGVEGRSWVAMGDPVGPRRGARRAGLEVPRAGATATAAGPCFYQVSDEAATSTSISG